MPLISHDFWVRRKNTSINLYKVSASRDDSVYPSTLQGYEDFRLAVSNGSIIRTTEDGCVIPVGTKAPLTKPTCSTNPPENPSYNRTLGVKTFGTGTEYEKAGTVDGVIKEGVLTWTLNDIPIDGDYGIVITYQSNTAVPTANFSINNGSAQGIELTASGGQLRTKTAVLSGLTAPTTILKLTPSGYMATASIQLIREGSSNPGTGGGGGSYNKVLIVGNSITYYPAPRSNWPGEPRGMAATAPNKDFVRLLTAKLQTNNANVQVRTFADFATETSNVINDATGPVWEANYWTTDLSKFNAVAAWQPDLIIMRLAENVTDSTHDFLTYYLALIDKLKSQSPNAKVVLTPSVWGQTDVTNAIATAASQRSYPYANTLASMWTSNNDLSNPYYAFGVYSDAGVSKHPNDAGMQRIADEIWAKIPSNTTTTPPITNPSADFVSQTDEGWTVSVAADMKYIENEFIKVGFRRQVGGAICYAAFKSTNRNLVNDPQFGPNSLRSDDATYYPWRQGLTFSDKGRQWMFAPYLTPGTAWQVTPQKNTNGFNYDTGKNFVQGGSLGNFFDESQIVASKIYTHPKYGQMFYVKLRPAVWAVPHEWGDFYIEQWNWLQGTTIGYFAKMIVGTGTVDSQTKYEARQQELPCFYCIGPLTYQRMVTQDATPWTNAGTVDRSKPDFGSNNNFTAPYISPECWLSQGQGSGGVTVALYQPGIDRGDGKKVGLNSRFIAGQFDNTTDEWSGLGSAYGASALMANFDNPGTYETSGYFVLGTSLADTRTKLAALPRPDQSFDFDFSNELHSWWNLNCRMKKEGSGYVAYLGDLNQDGGTHGEVKTPYGAWDASQITTLEFDMEVYGATAFWLEWKKPGESNDDSRRYRKAFTGLIGDGVRRTYTISTSNANWNGIIACSGLKAIANDGQNQGNPTTPSGAKVKFYRVRKIN